MHYNNIKPWHILLIERIIIVRVQGVAVTNAIAVYCGYWYNMPNLTTMIFYHCDIL